MTQVKLFKDHDISMLEYQINAFMRKTEANLEDFGIIQTTDGEYLTHILYDTPEASVCENE